MKNAKSLIVFTATILFLITLAFIYPYSSGLLTKVEQIKNFTLKDYNGNEHSLSDYKDSRSIVIIFIATQCPVSNAYNERMELLYESYRDKGIAFLGINSNKTEDVEEIKEHAKKKNLSFTILKDNKNVIADMFEASFTPEVYVLSNRFQVLYHGRIDNSRRESEVISKDLANTLDEILAGSKVSNPETKAFGCTIKRI